MWLHIHTCSEMKKSYQSSMISELLHLSSHSTWPMKVASGHSSVLTSTEALRPLQDRGPDLGPSAERQMLSSTPFAESRHAELDLVHLWTAWTIPLYWVVLVLFGLMLFCFLSFSDSYTGGVSAPSKMEDGRPRRVMAIQKSINRVGRPLPNLHATKI